MRPQTCLLRAVVLAICIGSTASCANHAVTPPAESSAEVATLVVPRFNGGSVPVDPGEQNNFLFHRGYPARQLRVGDTYDGLLSQLRSHSASPQSVIGASYDWRMPGAPPQDKADGTVTGLLAHWNDPKSASTFTYAVDYLRYWLIQATRVGTGTQVNVVAHSTGGTLVRAYMQSDAYGQIVVGPDGQPVRLPTIANLVLAVPPMLGAPFVWNIWNGNFASFVGAARGADIFAGYTTAYDYVLGGGAISGPGGAITKATLKGRGLARQVSFLHQYNPLLKIILPTYAFLYPTGSEAKAPVTINDDQATANDLLLDLNAGSTAGSNPWTQLAGHVVVTYPVHVLAPPAAVGSPPVATTVADQTKRGTGGEIVPFTAFAQAVPQAIPTKPGQVWYREVSATDSGDGAFPLRSMQEPFFNSQAQPDPEVTVQQWGNGTSPPAARPKDSWVQVDGNLNHNQFIENPAITSWISAQVPNH